MNDRSVMEQVYVGDFFDLRDVVVTIRQYDDRFRRK